MRIAIIGTGGVALGCAALLAARGHEAVLVSLSGRGLAGLEGGRATARGAIGLEFSVSATADMGAATAGRDGVVIAIPANRHMQAMTDLARVLTPGQQVLVSAELSMSGAWLARRLGARGRGIPVTSLATTVVMGRRVAPAEVVVGGIRNRCEAATAPAEAQAGAIAFWRRAFGEMLVPAASPLTIALSNLNPPVHLANCLGNFTRIEKAERWSNYGGITPGVARMIERLDDERLAIARRLGVEVRSIHDHYRYSFGFAPGMSLAEMAAEVDRRRGGAPVGPVTLDSRFLTEDAPFGVAFIEWMGQKHGVATPLHSAGLKVLSALAGQEFRSQNAFLQSMTA